MDGVPLMGGLDQIEFLRKASPVEVRERVRQMAATVESHGRFILGTSDDINEYTPVENLHALRLGVEALMMRTRCVFCSRSAQVQHELSFKVVVGIECDLSERTAPKQVRGDSTRSQRGAEMGISTGIGGHA